MPVAGVIPFAHQIFVSRNRCTSICQPSITSTPSTSRRALLFACISVAFLSKNLQRSMLWMRLLLSPLRDDRRDFVSNGPSHDLFVLRYAYASCHNQISKRNARYKRINRSLLYYPASNQDPTHFRCSHCTNGWPASPYRVTWSLHQLASTFMGLSAYPGKRTMAWVFTRICHILGISTGSMPCHLKAMKKGPPSQRHS